jgi:hypothetical protein
VPAVPLLSIGELARRTGLSVSAIRFYEERGLVKAVCTAGSGASCAPTCGGGRSP